MTTYINGSDTCCPVNVGEVCLVGGQRGVIMRDPDGTLHYTNVNTGNPFNPATDIVACDSGITVRAQHVLLTAGQSWPITGGPVAGALVSVSFTVLTGTASVTDSNGTVAAGLPAGTSATWSAEPSASNLTGPTAITAAASSSVYVNWTER